MILGMKKDSDEERRRVKIMRLQHRDAETVINHWAEQQGVQIDSISFRGYDTLIEDVFVILYHYLP